MSVHITWSSTLAEEQDVSLEPSAAEKKLQAMKVSSSGPHLPNIVADITHSGLAFIVWWRIPQMQEQPVEGEGAGGAAVAPVAAAAAAAAAAADDDDDDDDDDGGTDTMSGTNPWPPLMWACYHGETERVRELLGKGVDANWTSPRDGSSPLYWASRRGHVACVHHLLAGKACVATRTVEGWNSLMAACWMGHKDVVALLLSSGGYDDGLMEEQDPEGRTALYFAVRYCKVDVASLLLRHGAEPRSVTDRLPVAFSRRVGLLVSAKGGGGVAGGRGPAGCSSRFAPPMLSAVSSRCLVLMEEHERSYWLHKARRLADTEGVCNGGEGPNRIEISITEVAPLVGHARQQRGLLKAVPYTDTSRSKLASAGEAGGEVATGSSTHHRSPEQQEPQQQQPEPSRLGFLVTAFTRMLPTSTTVHPEGHRRVGSALPPSGFAPPGTPAASRSSSGSGKKPMGGHKRRERECELVVEEPLQMAVVEEDAGREMVRVKREEGSADEREEGDEEEEDGAVEDDDEDEDEEDEDGEDSQEGEQAGGPVRKKHKVSKLTKIKMEFMNSPANAVTQIGHFKVINGLINHPRGFRQRIEMLKDSMPLWRAGDFKALRERFEDQGYIVLRGFLPRERVIQAGLHARRYLLPEYGFDPSKPSNGLISLSSSPPPPPLPGDPAPEPDEPWKTNIKKDKRVWGLLESVQVRSFMDKFAAVSGAGCKAKVLHPEMTWVRVKGHKQFSKVHADYFYMKGDTVLFEGAEVDASLPCDRCKSPDDEAFMLICDECDRAYHTWCLSPPLAKLPTSHSQWFCPKCTVRPQLGSLWVPLQDVSLDNGGLCVVPTSHRILPDYDLICRDSEVPATYWTMGRDLVWHVGSFEAGDVVLFDWKLVHAATSNKTEAPRISIDTRWSILPPRDTRLTRVLNSWGTAKPTKPAGGQSSRPPVLRTRGQIIAGSSSSSSSSSSSTS